MRARSLVTVLTAASFLAVAAPPSARAQALDLKATPPAEGSTGVLYPGEMEDLCEQERRRTGIDVEDATWNRLAALAGEYGLAAELGLE